jgi:hypothetical protein
MDEDSNSRPEACCRKYYLSVNWRMQVKGTDSVAEQSARVTIGPHLNPGEDMSRFCAVLLASFAFLVPQAAWPQQTKSETAQSSVTAKPADVKSMDAIMQAVYDVISGPPGERDWNRFRSLFVPGARLIAVTHKSTPAVLEDMTAEKYVDLAGGYFKQHGFFEREISHKVESFGSIAHVFSTYESRETADGKPFVRGINSFQLLNDGTRWWVVSIYWDEERPDVPIPAKYLEK